MATVCAVGTDSLMAQGDAPTLAEGAAALQGGGSQCHCTTLVTSTREDVGPKNMRLVAPNPLVCAGLAPANGLPGRKLLADVGNPEP